MCWGGGARRQWVNLQRSNAKDLTANRRAKLERLKFDFTSFKAEWDGGLNKLLVHKNNASLSDGHALGSWLDRQVRNQQELSPERFEKLKALGVLLKYNIRKWEGGLQKLKQFKAREGHTRVPQSHSEGGYSLGVWVADQRLKRYEITQNQYDNLEALGFDWATPRRSDTL